VGILKNNPFVEENFSLDNVPSGCTRVVLPMLYNGVIRSFLDVFCPYKDLILIPFEFMLLGCETFEEF